MHCFFVVKPNALVHSTVLSGHGDGVSPQWLLGAVVFLTSCPWPLCQKQSLSPVPAAASGTCPHKGRPLLATRHVCQTKWQVRGKQ